MTALAEINAKLDTIIREQQSVTREVKPTCGA
jgi:hypothetical protein